MLTKVGLYSWAGPQTIELLKTKYFNPSIDAYSLLHSYDYSYLKRMKEIFGITDAWVTYSWGFSDKHEEEGYAFIKRQLPNFKKLGIKTHAYLQGTNLVYEDFKGSNYWCEDNNGRHVTYYKGRKVTCVNNPHFKSFYFARLKKLLLLDFDGVYADNIQMGQLGVPMPQHKLPFVFAGCNCLFCREKFFTQTGTQIPTDFENNEELTKKYLSFRSSCVHEFVKDIADKVHQKNKLFGTNSYDPKFNSSYVYGFDIQKIAQVQDYVLFENHALTDETINNDYIGKLTKNIKKPVFVLSYSKGIGYESQFTQHQFDLVFSEAKKAKFYPVVKGSEYTTRGVWHNLYLDRLGKPETTIEVRHANNNASSFSVLAIFSSAIARHIVKKYYNQTYTLIMENKFVRPIMKLVYELVLH